MTKRMIDADALIKYLNDNHDKVVCGCTRSFIFTAKEKINEIAENNAENAEGATYDATAI